MTSMASMAALAAKAARALGAGIRWHGRPTLAGGAIFSTNSPGLTSTGDVSFSTFTSNLAQAQVGGLGVGLVAAAAGAAPSGLLTAAGRRGMGGNGGDGGAGVAGMAGGAGGSAEGGAIFSSVTNSIVSSSFGSDTAQAGGGGVGGAGGSGLSGGPGSFGLSGA